MGLKGKISVFFLFVAVVLVSATASVSRSERNAEIEVCKTRCVQEGDKPVECRQKCETYDTEKQKEGEGGQGRNPRNAEIEVCKSDCVQIGDQPVECRQKCETYDTEKQKKKEGGQSGRGGSGSSKGGDGHGGEFNMILADKPQDFSKIVEQCHQSCQGSQGEQDSPICFQTCMQKQIQEQGKRKGSSGNRRQETSKKSGKQQSNNPYVFQDHHFTVRLETEQGNVKVLQKFTDRSELFKGIQKYRVAFLEAEPQTFIIPNHWDADALIYVVNGKGTISLINPNSRQSHNIKRGDIFLVPAGISAYLINRDNNEKLVLAKILRSVSVPGELQTFFSVGGDNPESSFFSAFSTEVLEAAFNVERDSLERMFGKHKQEQEKGIFKKATEEQIRSLTGKDEGRTWPFGERKGPYNIYKKNPSVANDNGNLYEVDSDDFSDLKDINVAFSFFNISQGSMAGPFYNTKATTVLIVSNGEGQFEMACPHLSEQASKTSGEFNPSYEQVSSELRRGTVVVIPAGHPIVIEASGNQDLEVISFGLNSDKNEWFPVVGRDGVISQWEDEALELTFGVPANEVKKVIQKQSKRLFFKGPVRRGRAFV